MARLPKQFWRVDLIRGEGKKLRAYQLGGKTYASRQHAINQYNSLNRRGIKAEIWESSPVTWTKVVPAYEGESDESRPE